MIQLIEQCLSAKDYNTTHECLKIYKSTFGYDDFYMVFMNSLTVSAGPSVTLIYIKQSSEATQTCLENVKTFQNYKNLDIICLSADNLLEEFCQCITSVESEYICFLTVSINMIKTVFRCLFLSLRKLQLLTELSAHAILLI